MSLQKHPPEVFYKKRCSQTDKTYIFFNILFIFGFYKHIRHISADKAFIGRSRIPATSKLEAFEKEVNGGKLLIVNTKRTIFNVAGCLQSMYICINVPIEYEILGC